ncbi:MAG: cysteine--tRNA ligase [Candidatus Lloydbacteria bacterium RIFCSPLOWO2_01_FULL_50_20]|uniref:Cysteine--tRNA ligase n=1 Tax=Candidatus Lloydbacteria bacterium RIFCSPLOWO2_01_FULL_50_20 TaxID=1798665 RepID=A0A1G2DL93_9BACT|nr:MAG: cysteine--tRNA ligase [Candidatus Lloydbacteria bacterium RIFCSPHIGHO2_02_FULL_50_11]OGZ13741.1 MAG: cysteine--tRNA ligase [Candidatus Lloydbacteria bacterium RIFCSPLOWO2_01_FULL_50_20]
MGLRLYNTQTRQTEEFTPPPRLRASDGLAPYEVKMYNCGPTVYNYAHIGNLRAYVFADILRRTLEMEGYSVKQIVNITDVGHLVSDNDEGEDKIEEGARREGKSTEEIIGLYSQAFYDDLKALNVLPATKYPRATQYIDEQKALIETLDKKGFLYTTEDGVYFDTTKFPRYADFAKLDIAGMQAGARVSMGEKKHPTDFAVWKFSPEDGNKREQEWDSPLRADRKGFPGWHIECSAIAMKELGETIDIHTGGVDHIPVHHTNEIAQSECATGKQFARYWMHSAHMLVDGQKMSKSLGNTYRLSDLAEKGIAPLTFRYWLLTAHYRTQVNFTWDALKGAQNAYERLRRRIFEIKKKGVTTNTHPFSFVGSVFDDLDTASDIASMWQDIQNNEYDSKTIIQEVEILDKFLGLKLLEYAPEEVVVTSELQKLLDERKTARDAKNFAASDRLRDEIRKLGYEVKDTPEGQRLEKTEKKSA